jgi:hypothetical protein
MLVAGDCHCAPFLRAELQRGEAKVPAVVPHSLRGLHATLASGFGATSHAVAAAPGHTSFIVTARHYVDRDTLEQARSRRSRDVLSGNCDQKPVTGTRRRHDRELGRTREALENQ